jgi:hypothetical protein
MFSRLPAELSFPLVEYERIDAARKAKIKPDMIQLSTGTEAKTS